MNDTKIKTISDTFWLNDISILYQKNRLHEFFPSPKYSKVENLNALVRLATYCSVILTIHRKNIKFLFISIMTAVLTLFIHRFSSIVKKEELTFEASVEKCTMPSKDNPFMNTLLTDIGVYKERDSACEGEAVEELIEGEFHDGLYQDVNDIYQKKNSQRQFFTMPNTTELGVKNGETVKFANWLYNKPRPTCKEDPAACTTGTYYHEELRSKSLFV
jgi:hypothetical protein